MANNDNPFATLGREWLATADDGGRAYLAQGWLAAASRALRRARQGAGLTQRELAKRLGTKQSAIARWENDSNGSISLNNFVEFLIACGRMPYEMEYVDLEELREYAQADPLAPTTVGTIGAWRRGGSESEQLQSSEQPQAMPDLAREVGYSPAHEPGQNGKSELPEPPRSERPLDGLALARDLLGQAKQSHAAGDVNRAIQQIEEGRRALEGVSGKEAGELAIELLYYRAEFLQDIRQSTAALHAINAALMRRQNSGVFGDEGIENVVTIPTADLYRSRASIRVARGVDDDWRLAALDYNKSFTCLGRVTDPSRHHKVEAKILTSWTWFQARKGDYGVATSLVQRGLDVSATERREAYFFQLRAAAQRAIKTDRSSLLSEDALPPGPPAEQPAEEAGARQTGEDEGWNQILQDGIKALKGFEDTEDWRNAAAVRIELAGVHTDCGRHIREPEHFEVALWLAGHALRYSREMGINLLQIRARAQIGETLAAMGCFVEARAQIAKALELIPTIEDRFEVASTQKVAGTIHRQAAEVAQSADERWSLASEARLFLDEALATFSALDAHGQKAGTEAELDLVRAMVPEVSEPFADR